MINRFQSYLLVNPARKAIFARQD